MPPEENDDHIDKNEHIAWTKDDPMVKPERAAKGDLLIERDAETDQIRFAQAQVRNILNFLWNGRFIEDDHHTDGCLFEAWRAQHRVAMGQAKAISAGENQPSSGKLRAYGYILIICRLSVYERRAVSNAINTFANAFTEQQAYRDRLIYRRAFERLSLAMVSIRQRISYLESLSEDERNEHSGEALKKILAQRTENA